MASQFQNNTKICPHTKNFIWEPLLLFSLIIAYSSHLSITITRKIIESAHVIFCYKLLKFVYTFLAILCLICCGQCNKMTRILYLHNRLAFFRVKVLFSYCWWCTSHANVILIGLNRYVSRFSVCCLLHVVLMQNVEITM